MAKAEDFLPVSEDELLPLLQRELRTSVGYYDSKLSKERQEVLEYYSGLKPKPSHAGNSKYISMDVFDSVESMKAVLLETFAAGNKIVSFDPQTSNDVEDMRIATEYADYVVHRQNDSYNIFSTVIQDGLLARCGVAKVYWDEQIEEQQEEFENLTQDEVDMLLALPDVKDAKLEPDEDTGLFEGELTRMIDRSQVRIDPVAPEEFLISTQAVSIDKAAFVAHRTRKSLADLIAEGYDKKKVNQLGGEDDADALNTDPEVLARFESIGADRLNLTGDEVQPINRMVIVYECYLRLDMKGDGVTKLYKVTLSGNTILDHEEVSRKPFIHFCPIPMTHAFYGTNYAARVIPTQNARTVLVRGILDHTVITNNPRMMVVKGALTNPKELIENRVGGLVNVTRPDGIMPLPQAGLNPFVFQTIQLLDEDKEESTGISKLSQGLNKDAVSKQNSGAMVEQLVGLSQQREKIIARNFATQFIKPLYLEVYRLILENEKQEKIVRVAGDFHPVDPQTWAEQVQCTIELKLGYGEQEREAQKYMQMSQAFTQNPKYARMFGEQQAYNVGTKICELMGIKDVSSYLSDPAQLPAPQPDPMMVKQMQLEERKVGTQETIANAQAQKVTIHAQLEIMQLNMERLHNQFEQLAKQRDLDRKEFEATSKAAIAAEELELAKKEAEQNPAQTRAIISPN